jgi:hypothetical protein
LPVGIHDAGYPERDLSSDRDCAPGRYPGEFASQEGAEMKFADFLNSFSSAMSQHQTAMEKLQDAVNEVSAANDAINTSVSSFNDLDLSEWFNSNPENPSYEIDFKSNNISDWVDLEGIANANPVTEIMNEVKGMANLFKFDIF